MKFLTSISLFVCISHCCFAQYYFSGYVDTERWQGDVYLSIIEDYRTLENIDNEQIISKTTVNSNGFFQFSGNQLEPHPCIYKLHVDNCDSNEIDGNHFDGHCFDSKDILFIAQHTDTIHFPLSFDTQMFCDIKSTNPKAAAFIKIDSLKEEMKFAYSEFRSKANRDLNNKKWFKTLQDYGEQLNEPLAELYIYAFLSERGSPFHNFYLEDLQTNSYYDHLLERLNNEYPYSKYTKQYEAEISSDRFIANPSRKSSTFNWTYLITSLLIISLSINLWYLSKYRAQKKKLHSQAKEQLTKQEQNVLELILKEYSNKEIADTLFVSISTVKTHVNNIYKKLNVNSREDVKNLFNR
ncbi:response regulator transcription factor [Seonamhaeicola sp. NFXS20]|uniref:helix-turn-helix domain-containing protein n=1 Tax=Seonamhaeicola sp. NFXS20 TaxID=2816959 RepID=UPI003B8DC57B